MSCECQRFGDGACACAAVTPVVYYDRVTGGEADRPAASAVQSVQAEDPASDVLASGSGRDLVRNPQHSRSLTAAGGQ